MSDPTPYVRGFNFAAASKGTEINIELANVSETTTALVEAVKDIRRSDGALQNQIVTADSLADGLTETLADRVAGVYDAAAVSALASADRAELYGPRTFDTYAALAADTILTPTNTPAGSTVSVRGVGDYIAVASGEHITTASGLKLKVAPINGWRHVDAFGAVADGVTDSGAAIQAAFNALPAASVEFGAGSYVSTIPLSSNARPYRGPGSEVCTLAAGAAMSVLMTYSGQHMKSGGIYYQGNGLAETNLLGLGCNGSEQSNFRSEGAIFYGHRFAATGNNSTSAVRQALIRNNGRSYGTGTAATVAASGTVTFSGAVDLTTLFTAGESWLYVAGQEVREVTAVSATTLTVVPVFAATASGLAYSIRQGANLYIMANGDNSEIKVENIEFQNAPVGLDDRSLYGAKADGNVYEFCKIARSVNRLAAAMSLTRGGCDNNAYLEGNDVDFYLAGVFGFEITGGNDDPDPIVIQRKSNAYLKYSRGAHHLPRPQRVIVNDSMGETGEGNTRLIAIGAPAKTVILPTPKTGILGSSQSLEYTVLTALQSGGYTLITTTDGATINGVAGATGIKVYGDRKTVRLSYVAYTNDWFANPADSIISGSGNSGGGVAAGAVYNLPISGFDATTARVIAKSQGGGENIPADAWLTECVVISKTTSGCTLSIKNLGASTQTLSVDYFIIQF